MGFLLPFIFTSLFAWAGPKEDTLKELGKFAYEVDYFGEESFRRLSLDSGEVDRLRKEPGYRETYQRYLAYGAKAQIEEKLTRAPASVPSVTDKAEAFVFPVSQNLGLIAFKRGDLKAACPKVVQAAKALGADRIAYYHPVHFSGGNSKNYRMPERPEYGVHYRTKSRITFRSRSSSSVLISLRRRSLSSIMFRTWKASPLSSARKKSGGCSRGSLSMIGISITLSGHFLRISRRGRRTSALRAPSTSLSLLRSIRW